ncbi:MAG: endonuclease III [Planctomycetota bacterium]|nr:endonuclease III [Planctomycetota bacterium]
MKGAVRPARVGAAQRARAAEIFGALRERYPDARCELNYSSARELLIATILSAQSTDAGVNRATPGLFAAFPTAESLARAEPEEVEPFIRTIGLYRNKAKSIVSAMRTLVERHGGEVPRTMEELLELRGVARKTANVVLGNAFGINEGVVVDTHVERLAKRFGLAKRDATVAVVEKRLMGLFPRESWWLVPHLLIFHGRRVCRARGALCAEDAICRRFCANAVGKRGAAGRGAGAGRGRE